MIIVGPSGKRVAESFEGSASGAPLLHVEFSMPIQMAVPAFTATFTTGALATSQS